METKGYERYLGKKGYNSRSIPTYQRGATRFDKWCKKHGTTAGDIDYKTFLRYVAHLRKGQACGEHGRTITTRTLKTYIGNLKIYFDHLVEEGDRTANIIKDLNIKGVKKTVISNFLEPDELEDLYYSYPTEKGGLPLGGNVRRTKGLARKRNKIIVGLLVYQGLNTRDLQLLEVEHVRPYRGRLTVPGTQKSNTRDIELKPWQLMEFMEYINEVRPRILKETGKATEQLLLPIGKSHKLHNTIGRLAKELKQLNNAFTDIKQIRNSVIIGWLKLHGLRRTQYLAGHKYISSTERYLQDDLESLHETINTYHPLS